MTQLGFPEDAEGLQTYIRGGVRGMAEQGMSDEEHEMEWNTVGDDTSVLKSISQSSVSISTNITSATDVVGLQPWSDSLGGSSSGARVHADLLSSGNG